MNFIKDESFINKKKFEKINDKFINILNIMNLNNDNAININANINNFLILIFIILIKIVIYLFNEIKFKKL